MTFFSFFGFGQNETRNKVYDVLDRKETFYDYKTTILQGLKNGIFPKGLTHAFGQKMQFFSWFVFRQKRLEIRFNDVLDRKETFLDYKNNSFSTTQKWHFPKGLTTAFGQKMQFFSLFVFA